MLEGRHIPHCLNDRTKIIRFIKIASIFHFLVQNHYLRVEKSETMNNLIILAATAVPQAAEPELSLWSMIVKGGWLMIPIFILSIIAVYIFCERYMLLRKYTRISDTFPDKIRDCIFAGNIRGAVTVCKEENTPMSRRLVKGLLHYRLPVTELRAIVESAANLEVAGMEKGLSTLATCAGMAPMIGFLGTVVGMVQAFYDMAMAGNNINITLLSRGIYTAMITTVAGLIVGIIAYFAYNALTAKIDHIVTKMETASADFMEVIYEVKNEKENK